MKIALIQMVSEPYYVTNLAKLEQSLQTIALTNAVTMVILPEFFIQMSDASDKFAIAEEFNHGTIQAQLANLAIKYQVYLVAGTIPLLSDETGKFYNSCLVFAPSGEVIARYDKMHLFRLQDMQESYNESINFKQGNQIVKFSIGEYNFGLAICYDLRFPELFRQMTNIDAIILPAAFTKTTGIAHWEVLCRARAIENQCYMLAVNQGGDHLSGRVTYGHTMAINPWGEVIAKVATGEHILYVELDKALIERFRNKLPALDHRVLK